MQKLVLNEWESSRVKFLNQFVDQLERKERDCHLWIHVVLKHEVILVFVLDESLRLIPPLVNGLEWQVVLEQELDELPGAIMSLLLRHNLGVGIGHLQHLPVLSCGFLKLRLKVFELHRRD